jgi:15-cis-phytoene synthase
MAPHSPLAADDLDAGIRRSDPDRWLSSRFIADPARRADVIALYAFDHELEQIARTVREPLAAEIRLTWWREAVEAIFAGKTAPGHPVLLALAEVIARRRLAEAPFMAMIDARIGALNSEPFADAPAVRAYLDATAGAVMALAVAILAEVDAAQVQPPRPGPPWPRRGPSTCRSPPSRPSPTRRWRGLIWRGAIPWVWRSGCG